MTDTPTEMLEETSAPLEIEQEPRYAGFNVRIGAALIDSIILLFFQFFFFTALNNYIYGDLDIQKALMDIQNQYLTQIKADGVVTPEEQSGMFFSVIAEFFRYIAQPAIVRKILISNLAQMIIVGSMIYACWIYRSATPGKILLGLKIVNADDFGTPDKKRFFRRILGYFLSSIPFGMGFLAIGTNSRKQGWHDKIADTVVIYTKRGLEEYIPKKVQYFLLGICFIIGINFDYHLTLAIAGMILLIKLSKKINLQPTNPFRILKIFKIRLNKDKDEDTKP